MPSKAKKPTCLRLFLETLSLSAFTIGGGYVMIPLLRGRFVEKLGWIDENQLEEMTAIGQSSPGAMIINVTALLGYRLLGFWGAVSALLGTALPAIVLLSIMCYFYDLIRDNRYVSAAFRGMNAGVAAIMVDTVLVMATPYVKKKQFVSVVIMICALIAAIVFKINVALVIVACGVLGVIIGTIQDKRKKI